MWDLIASVPDHCLSFYFSYFRKGCGHREENAVYKQTVFLQTSIPFTMLTMMHAKRYTDDMTEHEIMIYTVSFEINFAYGI